MRIRSTKPEFWRSKTIAALPWDVRLVLKGLESYVDDNGVGKDDIALIAADVFPRDLSANPPETLARLTEAISALSDGGLVARYDVNGEDLLYIDRWKELQRIDKPTKGRFRRPDGTLDYSEDVARESYRNPPVILARAPEVSAPGAGEQGNRGTGEIPTPTESGGRPRADPVESNGHDPNCQALVAEWLDHTDKRPPGNVIGQVGKNLKMMLDEGIAYGDVRGGLALWARKGLHPASLPSVVHEFQVKADALGKPSTTDERVNSALALAARFADEEAAS